MNQTMSNIAKEISVDVEKLEKFKQNKQTISYLKAQLEDPDMPDPIREMNQKLLDDANSFSVTPEEAILTNQNLETADEKVLTYLEEYSLKELLTKTYNNLVSYKNILESEIDITHDVRKQIEDLKEEAENIFDEQYNSFIKYLEKEVKKEYFGIVEADAEEKPKEAAPAKKQIRYIVKKANLTLSEIREIIVEYIKEKETMFNRIVFDGKAITLSITDRILDVYFKPGIGYIVMFISEPDTNQGKFYHNLLKVFEVIKEEIYEEHEIVVLPEDGKGLPYLNSFYQNYIFVKEKFDGLLTKYKLQQSKLNETFSIKHMIFDKSENKYLVYYTGNKELSGACEQYLKNQAKLGPVYYDIEYIEMTKPINDLVRERYFNQKNKIDFSDTNNYLKIKSLSQKPNEESAYLKMSGVGIIVDPGSFDVDGLDKDMPVDIIILTNARKNNLEKIPAIMMKYPDAKLFTSDITFKAARIIWLNAFNSMTFGVEETMPAYTKKDLDGLSERIIRITPEGKGYNYRQLVNIKFFNAGVIPGNACVEFRDSEAKILYLGNFNINDTELMLGGEVEFSDYDYIIAKQDIKDEEIYLPLDITTLKEKIGEGKQIFVFSDTIGNLQHLTKDFYDANLENPVIAGDQSFVVVNKEIAKLINFGSSWGDFLKDKTAFSASISSITPFVDEYEFYKKFSTSDPFVFLMQYRKEDLDSVIKNKLDSGNVIIVPKELESDLSRSIEDYIEKGGITKNNSLVIPYNYVSRANKDDLNKIFSNSSKLKKVFLQNGLGADEVTKENSVMIVNTDICVYGNEKK